jgi:transposase-like protein
MPKSKSRPLTTRIQRWTLEQARTVLEKQAASGLPVSQFAAREGLESARLYRWRERLGVRAGQLPAAGAAFVEVKAMRPSRVELVLRSGHVLFVPDSFDAGALTQLIEILERATGC